MLFEGVSCKPWVTGVATHLSVGVVGVLALPVSSIAAQLGRDQICNQEGGVWW